MVPCLPGPRRSYIIFGLLVVVFVRWNGYSTTGCNYEMPPGFTRTGSFQFDLGVCMAESRGGDWPSATERRSNGDIEDERRR